MARESRSSNGRSRRRPATTPEERELQLSDLAYDLAEDQIRSGTASSQVITHFLKMGSTRERLEQQRMEHEMELMRVRQEELQSRKRIEDMYSEALGAMRSYQGLEQGPDAEGTADDF